MAALQAQHLKGLAEPGFTHSHCPVELLSSRGLLGSLAGPHSSRCLLRLPGPKGLPCLAGITRAPFPSENPTSNKEILSQTAVLMPVFPGYNFDKIMAELISCKRGLTLSTAAAAAAAPLEIWSEVVKSDNIFVVRGGKKSITVCLCTSISM